MHAFQNDDDDEIPLSKFESMLKTNSVYFFDSTEFEEIIIHYMNVGKMSLAKKALDLGLRQHPDSVALKLAYVEVLLYEDKINKAEQLLMELEEIDPLNDQVFLHKASLLSKKDKHKEAIVALNQALLYTEDEGDVYSMIGMEYLYLEDFDTARLHFAKCLEVEFDDYSALYNVIYCFDMLDQHEEAIDYLVDYINKDPYSEIAWHQLGRQYFMINNFVEALKAFDYSILIDEYFIGAYLEKAKTLEELKRYEEAIANYQLTINLEDGSSFTYLRIANCYEKMGEVKKALKYYNITVKEDPLLDKGWLALTDLYIKNKNYQKALYFINKALLIDDSNSVYWLRYAEINLKLNFFEEAIRGFQKCLDLEDYALGIFIALTDVLHFIGEFKDAIDVLLKAREFYNDFAEIEYRLAGLYILSQQEVLGLELLEKALKLDYDYHYIIKELYPSVFELEDVKILVAIS
ncbi:tetratricopeptide repeat protein [Aureibaculum marinum]|uniref:tetratricopeptide repeat protein n=1 Tax=Aureibaculum marinum TaxID=2487930 RepID=UPI001EF06C11|nr:tetratricopeptide repeat protein [Aureibaculum marinum]